MNRQTHLTNWQNHRLEIVVATFVVILLHGGLVYWLKHGVEQSVKPNEKIIEIAMVSIPAPKAVSQPKPNAPVATPKPISPKPYPYPYPKKPIKTKAEPKTSAIKTTAPKTKPVIEVLKPFVPKLYVPTPATPNTITQPPANTAIKNTSTAEANSAPKTTTPLPATSASATVPNNKPVKVNQVACIDCPKPKYPRAAQRRNLQGTVQLKLELSSDGHVIHVTVIQSSGHAVLDDAAVADVQAWLFAPGTPGVSRMATQLINFKM